MQYRFGTFLVNPAARLLQRESIQLAVPRKVFDCLAYLIQHRDRAISRDELARALWKHASVSDNQLAQVVTAARRLVDDDGKVQRLIRTVAGFGYHWIGSVEVVVPVDPEPADGEASIETDDGDIVAARETVVAAEETVPIAPAGGFIPASASTSPPPSTVPSSAPAMQPGRRPTRVALLLLVLLILLSVWQRPPIDDRPTAERSGDAAGTSQVWVLPAVLADESEAWARVGLMALVGEGLRRTGAVVAPVEKVLARVGEPIPNDRLPRLLSELNAAMVIAPRVHRLGEAWLVELTAASKAGDSVRVDARDSDLTAAARNAVSRLNRRLQRTGAGLDGSIDESFLLIEQAILARDFEGALLQLSRLPPQAREMPEAGILEIQLDLEKGRYSEARDQSEYWLGRLDRTVQPVLHARAKLLKIAAMRQLNEPGWAPLVEEALELLKNTDAPRDLAIATQLRGIAAIIAGRQTDAARDLARAREMYLALGDELRAARTASTMAQMAELQGRHMEAIALLEQSNRVLNAYGAVGPLIINARWTAYVFIELSRWGDVLRVTDEMRPLLQAGGGASSYEQFAYLRVRTWALMELGRIKEAEALLDEQVHHVQREASENRSSDGGLVEQVEIARQRARIRIMQGRWEQAVAEIAHGLELMSRIRGVGESRLGRDDAEALLALFIRAQAGDAPWDPQTPLPQLDPDQIQALRAAEFPNGIMARAYWNARRGNFEDAEADYQTVLAMERTQRSPGVMLDVMEAYTQFLLFRGRVRDASLHIDHVEAQAPGAIEQDYGATLALLRVRLAEEDRERTQVAARRALALIGERQPPADLRPILESVAGEAGKETRAPKSSGSMNGSERAGWDAAEMRREHRIPCERMQGRFRFPRRIQVSACRVLAGEQAALLGRLIEADGAPPTDGV
ncbi:MAG: winged helix-turn-helix domain-containing protein [Xanthomonadales bacterium]|nr:hypothetical protein [Xanthomonadales bacterium]MCC6594574.1 winged helix-turn-helix domain-containing protein [Xanthomonadales bacterium]MCE7932072.1 hypothetical protein [Xanthomonadales bacterium PRO6]